MSSNSLYYPIQIKEVLVQVTFEATNANLPMYINTCKIPVDHKKNSRVLPEIIKSPDNCATNLTAPRNTNSMHVKEATQG